MSSANRRLLRRQNPEPASGAERTDICLHPQSKEPGKQLLWRPATILGMHVDRWPNAFTAKQKIDRSVTVVTRKRQLCDDRHYAPVFSIARVPTSMLATTRGK